MVWQETIYAGTGKVMFNENILSVVDHNGKLLLDIVLVDEYNYYIEGCD